jgi:hypothetical protein
VKLTLPRVLIYKRTHIGDPTTDGVFGLSDCMGRVRARDYGAVIGVGGLSAEPRSFGIDGRVTWVGVGARRSESIPAGHRGPIVEFDCFRLFDETGPKLDSLAPALAQHLFGVHRRVIMSDKLNATMQREIAEVLALAAGGSTGRGRTAAPRVKCPAKRKTAKTCAPAPRKASICHPRRRSRIC